MTIRQAVSPCFLEPEVARRMTSRPEDLYFPKRLSEALDEGGRGSASRLAAFQGTSPDAVSRPHNPHRPAQAGNVHSASSLPELRQADWRSRRSFSATSRRRAGWPSTPRVVAVARFRTWDCIERGRRPGTPKTQASLVKGFPLSSNCHHASISLAQEERGPRRGGTGLGSAAVA